MRDNIAFGIKLTLAIIIVLALSIFGVSRLVKNSDLLSKKDYSGIMEPSSDAANVEPADTSVGTEPADTNTPQVSTATAPTNGLTISTDVMNIDDEVNQNINPLAGKNIFFSGLSDSVLNKRTIVYLENVADNSDDIFMKYDIYNGDELIYSTDLIPAGKAVEWIAGETLATGEYDLVFNETPYWQNEYGEFVQLTSGANTVHFTMVN